MIFVLSLLIILLNFRLVIIQAKEEIDLLLQLGYFQNQVYSYLNRKLINWFSFTSFSGFILLLLLHWVLARSAQAQGLEVHPLIHPLVWLLAILLSAGFIYLNYWSIKRNVRRIGEL
ncbi:MAG: hypothetical protein IPJ40_23190 [Saprospirales bacterium]|nr:hypothetical protein [Saprospirales bacterium]